MSDYAQQAQEEMWAAIASQEISRYQLVQRWSSTNDMHGWMIWDTRNDRSASGWHRDSELLAIECRRMNRHS